MLRILAATDLSPESHIAVMRAVKVATENDAWLRVVHASEAELSDDEQAEIESLADRLRASTPPEMHAHVARLRGAPLKAILEEVVTFAPDLIVLGGHRTARLRDALFGTFAARLLATTAVPVLIARSADCSPYRRLMAAVDGGDTAAQVLRLATRIASARHLYVVHAREVRAGERVGPAQAMAGLDDRSAIEQVVREAVPRSETLQVHLDVRFGDPFRVIEREVRQIEPDLLVIGTHGRKGMERLFFESIAEDVMAYIPLDILAVRVQEPAEPESEPLGPALVTPAGSGRG
jgi:nucleotide-binding universal stress UspA family protein